MEFEKLLRERYSCRKFTNKEVKKELLDKVLEAARLAPTAKNQQPFKIYIFKSEESLKKIDQISPCRYGAPVVLGFVTIEIRSGDIQLMKQIIQETKM